MASKNPPEVKNQESLPEFSVLSPVPITSFIKKYFLKIFILKGMALNLNACPYTQTRDMLSGNLIMLQFLIKKQGNIFKGTSDTLHLKYDWDEATCGKGILDSLQTCI